MDRLLALIDRLQKDMTEFKHFLEDYKLPCFIIHPDEVIRDLIFLKGYVSCAMENNLDLREVDSLLLLVEPQK